MGIIDDLTQVLGEQNKVVEEHIKRKMKLELETMEWNLRKAKAEALGWEYDAEKRRMGMELDKINFNAIMKQIEEIENHKKLEALKDPNLQ